MRGPVFSLMGCETCRIKTLNPIGKKSYTGLRFESKKIEGSYIASSVKSWKPLDLKNLFSMQRIAFSLAFYVE